MLPLHRLCLLRLAATQSMYPADVCAALERARLRIVVLAPSKGVAEKAKIADLNWRVVAHKQRR